MSTPRYQHVQFYKIKIGEDFFFRKFRYTKTAYLLGRTILDGNAALVMPWTRVRSTRPFGKLANCSVGLNTEMQTLTGEGPVVDVARVVARNAEYIKVINGGDNVHFGKGLANDCEIPPGNTGLGGAALRDPQGDRRSETIGGSELTPSA